MGSTIVRLQVYSITFKLKNQRQRQGYINLFLLNYFNLYNRNLHKMVA